MLRNNVLPLSVMLSLLALPVCADTLSEIEFPKPPAYRVGISELPEIQYFQALHEKNKIEKRYAQIDDSTDANAVDLTYADLSIKRLSKEIAQDLEFEEQDMISDLSLLWQGAAVQSDTINFALYKLANPDADKPDSKSVKNVLKTIASMSTLVGASMGSPLLAGSSLIGGNILGIMSQDTKALNYKYTRVNDADMIILIRKVEDLQQKAVNLYYDYMGAKKQLDLTAQLVEERQRNFNLAQRNNAPRELVVITDAYYRTALDKQRNAKAEFFSKRAALEQFVGNETFHQFEAELAARERGEKIERPELKPAPENQIPQDEVSDTVVSPLLPDQGSVPVDNAGIEVEAFQQPDSAAQSLAKVDNTIGVSVLASETEEVSGEEFLTGSSSSIEDEDFEDNGKQGFFSKFRKSKQDDTVQDVKQVKSPKPDKYSTKGLIFLHGEDKQSAKQIQRESFLNFGKSDESTKSEKKSKNLRNKSEEVEVKQKSGFEFEPLDEIRVPDFNRGGGYSIHSESFEEINNGDMPIQY